MEVAHAVERLVLSVDCGQIADLLHVPHRISVEFLHQNEELLGVFSDDCFQLDSLVAAVHANAQKVGLLLDLRLRNEH